MLAFGCAAVVLVGLLWLLKPQDSILVPGALILNQREAQGLGFNESEIDRILRAYGTPDPWNLIRSRLFGFSFLSIGAAAYFAHISVSMLLAEVGGAIYCFAIVSVLARRQRDSRIPKIEKVRSAKDWRINDRVLVVTLLVASVNALFLAMAPSLPARIVAVVVFAVVPVAWYIWHACMLKADQTELFVALEWRQKSSWIATVIGTANMIAFVYGTVYLDPHDPAAIALRMWLLLGLGATLYYTRHVFSSSNRQLQSALR